MRWKIRKGKEKEKGWFSGLVNLEIFVDSKKIIDSTSEYVTCKRIDFDSKTKMINLS